MHHCCGARGACLPNTESSSSSSSSGGVTVPSSGPEHPLHSLDNRSGRPHPVKSGICEDGIERRRPFFPRFPRLILSDRGGGGATVVRGLLRGGSAPFGCCDGVSFPFRRCRARWWLQRRRPRRNRAVVAVVVVYAAAVAVAAFVVLEAGAVGELGEEERGIYCRRIHHVSLDILSAKTTHHHQPTTLSWRKGVRAPADKNKSRLEDTSTGET